MAPLILPITRTMTSIAFVTFSRQRLEMIVARERTHFWHAPRQRLLLETIAESALPRGSRLLDVGCGSGALVDALAAQGFDAHGLDPWAAQTRPGDGRFRAGQAESIPHADESFAAVCAFDVLEHADDRRALAELARVLEPGGLLFASVPAYQWLWSVRDDLAGHRRRYTRSLVRQRMTEAGFTVERLFGYQFLLLPLLVLARLAARARRTVDTSAEDSPPRLVNALLRTINAAEVSAGRWLRAPIGSSLICVATKRAARIGG